MNKADVLTILTSREAAAAINQDPSQITREKEIVREDRRKALKRACKKKVREINDAWNRIKED